MATSHEQVQAMYLAMLLPIPLTISAKPEIQTMSWIYWVPQLKERTGFWKAPCIQSQGSRTRTPYTHPRSGDHADALTLTIHVVLRKPASTRVYYCRINQRISLFCSNLPPWRISSTWLWIMLRLCLCHALCEFHNQNEFAKLENNNVAHKCISNDTKWHNHKASCRWISVPCSPLRLERGANENWVFIDVPVRHPVALYGREFQFTHADTRNCIQADAELVY